MKTDPLKKKHSAYHHGNLKEELVQTALVMIGEIGVDAITLRELGLRLGTSRSAIYRHFTNKEALMKQVILAGFEKLNIAISPSFDDGNKTLLERFYAMGKAYVNFALENQDLYRLLFGAQLMQAREEVCESDKPELHNLRHGNTDPHSLKEDELDTAFHKLVGIIVMGQDAGTFKKGDPILHATGVWSLLHGFSSLLIDGHVHVMDNLDALYESS
ncbi:MAG: hypothetical protein DRG24_03945, partial [Epsilonproteobacteria bacterium]